VTDSKRPTLVRRATHVTTFARGAGREWQATCSVCGRIGQPQEYLADAEAVATDHRERQGFSDGRAR
jgi:hypothetical protein